MTYDAWKENYMNHCFDMIDTFMKKARFKHECSLSCISIQEFEASEAYKQSSDYLLNTALNTMQDMIELECQLEITKEILAGNTN
jgi:hypothetical protein